MSSVFSKLRKTWFPRAKEVANENTQRFINAAGLYRAINDPSDIMRINAGQNANGVFDTSIAHPALPIPAHCHVFKFQNAYDVNTTNVWEEGSQGSGTGLAVQDSRGGVGKFTTAASDNDFYQYSSKYEIFKLADGKHLWFWGAFQASEATQSDIIFGLGARVNSGSIDPTHNVFDTGAGNRLDFVGFRKDDGDAYLDAECRKNGTATSSTAVLTVTASTDVFVGMHVIEADRVEFFAGTSVSALDDNVATITTNLPDDEELAFVFGLRNGDGNARSMSIYKAVIIQDV